MQRLINAERRYYILLYYYEVVLNLNNGLKEEKQCTLEHDYFRHYSVLSEEY